MAPIAEDVTTVSWQEARDSVLGAYADFSPETGDIVERFFDESWIDAAVRENKRTGRVLRDDHPRIVHPYILMNFTGDRRSVLTLAHELGHGLHGVLANPLGLFNADTPLTTAETASVFGEALTFKRLLAHRGGPAEAAQPSRRADRGRDRDRLPADHDEPLRGRRAHGAPRARASSRSSASRSSGSRRRAQMFGDSVDIDGYGTWWSYIPHFMSTPGYVYAYAYGFLFALAIFRRYEQEGEAMVEPYLEVLRLGGSRTPEELAEIVGLDLTDAEDLGERHRGALGRARRGRGARRGDRAGLTLSGRGSG